MDGLKLFANDDDELEGLLQTVKKFSDDIGIVWTRRMSEGNFFKRKAWKINIDRIR